MNINKEQLLISMKNFHTLLGIKFSVFDAEYNEVAAYPPNQCAFCEVMQGNPRTHNYCKASNARSFEQCRRTRELIVYRCHAGLIEASAPLEHGGVVFGYVIFGQMTDDNDEEHLTRQLSSVLKEYEIGGWNGGLPIYKKQEEIEAIAEILKACTSYLLLSEMVSPEMQLFIMQLNSYIDEHISEPLPVSRLCREFSVSRSRFYKITSQYLSKGVAEYILDRRIERAKELLTNTTLSVAEIACAVGFGDYNYFCHVFKQKTGKSTKQFR